MPRGKKARTDEGEKKEPEVKSKGKGKGKDAEVAVVVEEKKKETTHAEIATFLNSNSGNLDSIAELRDLVLNSSLSRKLVNAVMSDIFDLVEATPAHFAWGKVCIQMITTDILDPKTRIKEAFFFPSADSEKKLIRYLNRAEKTMLVCVFTITNDDLANAIRRARDRGVAIRIISDDDLLAMNGSDVKALHNEGFQVRVDLDMHAQMHNKFVIIDDYIVITGSFNWTKQAVTKNQENLVAMDDPVLAKSYTEQFNKMWEEFAQSVDRYLGGAVQVAMKTSVEVTEIITCSLPMPGTEEVLEQVAPEEEKKGEE